MAICLPRSSAPGGIARPTRFAILDERDSRARKARELHGEEVDTLMDQTQGRSDPCRGGAARRSSDQEARQEGGDESGGGWTRRKSRAHELAVPGRVQQG